MAYRFSARTEMKKNLSFVSSHSGADLCEFLAIDEAWGASFIIGKVEEIKALRALILGEC